MAHDELGQLPAGDVSRIQELREVLEHAWQEFDGSPAGVDLEPLLEAAGPSLRISALHTFIKTEMSLRLENGLPWDLDYFLLKFPELGGASNLSDDLICLEWLMRKNHGMDVSLADYKARFSERFQRSPELETMLQAFDTVPVAPVVQATPQFGVGAGRIVANRFLVQKRLGGGAYGEVWKVLDATGGIEKALKIIRHSMDSDEAKTEVQALEKIKNLENPFILRTDSFWVEEGRLLIVMELARGGSLRDCLKKNKQQGQTGIPVVELLGYMREAADALDYLHDERIVHRDIKPDNIVLVGNHAKLADLGLAKLMTRGTSMMASPLGSAPYMAPEVWRERVSTASDQYSLAVTYAELRQGNHPFKGSSYFDFFLAHNSGSAELDPSIFLHPEQEVILKALSRDPVDRFKSCIEFIAALESVLLESSRGLGESSWRGTPLNLPDDFLSDKCMPPSAEQPKRSQSWGRPTYAAEAKRSLSWWMWLKNLFGGQTKTDKGGTEALPASLPGQETMSLSRPAPSRDTPRQNMGASPPKDLPPGDGDDSSDGKSGNNVECAVFAPASVKQSEDFLLQVFAYASGNETEAAAQATEFDKRAARRGVTTLAMLIHNGQALRFHLCLHGLKVREATRQLIWQGKTSSIQFGVRLPKEYLSRSVLGTVLVSVGDIPVGRIDFMLKVLRHARARPAEAVSVGKTAVRFRKAFVSYASKDRSEVLRRIQMLRPPITEIEVFQDVLHLEPGAAYEAVLYKRIDECDIFLLFWSGNARASEWVRREIEYARRRQGPNGEPPPTILPIMIEGPPPPAPPPELAHMHFDDYLLYLMGSDNRA